MIYGNKVKNLNNKPPHDLRDVAPSILDLFDMPIPSYMEGTSIFSLQKKKNTSIPSEHVNDQSSYSDEEQGEIKERLKNLGYF